MPDPDQFSLDAFLGPDALKEVREAIRRIGEAMVDDVDRLVDPVKARLNVEVIFVTKPGKPFVELAVNVGTKLPAKKAHGVFARIAGVDIIPEHPEARQLALPDPSDGARVVGFAHPGGASATTRS